jgi:hypothetical protein
VEVLLNFLKSITIHKCCIGRLCLQLWTSKGSFAWRSWKTFSLVIILSLAILPQATFGQIPTLDKLNLNSSQSPQCLDFNQDKTCEFIVLSNGTMVENPSLQTTQLEKTLSEPTPKPLEGKCLGFQHKYCRNILLLNNTVVPNPNFVDTFDPDNAGPYAGSTDQTPQAQPVPTPQVQAQEVEEDDDSSRDDDEEENDTGPEDDEDKSTGSDCWENGDFVGTDECDTGGLPLCSEVESGRCFDEADFPDSD